MSEGDGGRSMPRGIILLVLLALVSVLLRRCVGEWVKYDLGGLERPGVYLEEAEDSGEDLTRNGGLGLWRKEDLGKRVRFTASGFFPNRTFEQNRQLYAVQEAATGYGVLLVSDRTLPELMDEGYFQVEGYITGHRVVEDGDGTRTEPAVWTTSITKVPKEDAVPLIFPALSSAEPGVSAAGDGVTLTLLRVDYCADMTRFYCRLENGSDGEVYISRRTLTRDGNKLSISTNQWPAVDNMLYMKWALDSSTPIAPGAERELLIATEPVRPGDSVELRLTLRPNLGDETGAWDLALPFAGPSA